MSPVLVHSLQPVFQACHILRPTASGPPWTLIFLSPCSYSISRSYQLYLTTRSHSTTSHHLLWPHWAQATAASPQTLWHPSCLSPYSLLSHSSHSDLLNARPVISLFCLTAPPMPHPDSSHITQSRTQRSCLYGPPWPLPSRLLSFLSSPSHCTLGYLAPPQVSQGVCS